MRLINSGYRILEQPEGLQGIPQAIESAGRIAYMSTAKEDSANRFVDMLISRGHFAPLEFGTVYIYVKTGSPAVDRDYIDKMDVVLFYKHNKYSKVIDRCEDGYYHEYYITTNYRVIIENDRHDGKFWCDKPLEFHEKRVEVEFTVNIAIAREIVRHRTFSFVNESTRFCNYSQDRFQNELTYIIPSWLRNLSPGTYKWQDPNPLVTAGMDIQSVGWDDTSSLWKVVDNDYLEVKHHYDNYQEVEDFCEALQFAEEKYFQCLYKSHSPQQARDILPLATRSVVRCCGFISDWKHFFELRTAMDAHPDIRELAIPLEGDFYEKGYLTRTEVCQQEV